MCVRCGMWGHKVSQCRVEYNVQCMWCGRTGHRIQACRKLGFSEGTSIHGATPVGQEVINKAYEEIYCGGEAARSSTNLEAEFGVEISDSVREGRIKKFS